MNGSELSSFDFERRFDETQALEWMQANWRTSFIFCSLYAALVFGGRLFMRERPKLHLRRPLALWSLSLAIFSIIGAIRTGTYMMHVLSSSGFKQSVCDISFYSAPITKFWAYAFAISKAPELGDTAFIILRKQRLIFLHWYHHITVLIYSWFSYKDQVAGGGWFMTMNYMVHSIMYTYYAARAAGLQVPRLCAMIITAAQILQMAMGLTVLGLVYHWIHDVHCPSNMDNIMWGSLMYFSYLVLFASFFYNNYLKDSSTHQRSKTE
ncbi:elongation of very long chain fatty acids protein 6-like [Cyprinodon tularosa]|uniref:Elongation of very long chain fatty acids protein 6 n=1 Tax=Cyprinodon variegatus TaxID=28743 RepID=A0A3Q2FZF9_CYPVA|nr:PREDICTED: elongation of very long chain fatty acids protein 6-like [Cyprinodon variegatus]XP_038130109.1 elongation of very long chain fatty acids protein 6-like [Cyprinodon tularosa]